MVSVDADMHSGVNGELLDVVFDCLHQIQSDWGIDIEIKNTKKLGPRGDSHSLGVQFDFDTNASSIGSYSYGAISEALEEEVEKHPKVTSCTVMD